MLFFVSISTIFAIPLSQAVFTIVADLTTIHTSFAEVKVIVTADTAVVIRL